jgi:hypothetical protein
MVDKNNLRRIDRTVQAMFATVAGLFQYACSCANLTSHQEGLTMALAIEGLRSEGVEAA